MVHVRETSTPAPDVAATPRRQPDTYTEIRELWSMRRGRTMGGRRDRDGLPILLTYPTGVRPLTSVVAGLIGLRHPNLVPILGHHPEEGGVLISEQVEAIPLSQLLERGGALTPAATAALLDGLLCALDALQRHDAIHGDVQPDTVLVDVRGDVQLLAAGLWVVGGPRSGGPGTPACRAPELWRSTAAGSAAGDVYAAAVVAADASLGRRAVEAGRFLIPRAHHRRAAGRRDELDPWLDAVVGRGLAPPSERPSAASLRVELGEAATMALGTQWRRRGRSALAAAVLACADLLPAVVVSGMSAVVEAHPLGHSPPLLAPARQWPLTATLLAGAATALVAAAVMGVRLASTTATPTTMGVAPTPTSVQSSSPPTPSAGTPPPTSIASPIPSATPNGTPVSRATPVRHVIIFPRPPATPPPTPLPTVSPSASATTSPR